MLFINTSKFVDDFELYVIENLKQKHQESEDSVKNPSGSKIHTVIIDLSAVSFIHSQGVKCLLNLRDQMQAMGGAAAENRVRLYLAAPQAPLFAAFTTCKFFDHFPMDHCFSSIKEALVAAQEVEEQNSSKSNEREEPNSSHSSTRYRTVKEEASPESTNRVNHLN